MKYVLSLGLRSLFLFAVLFSLPPFTPVGDLAAVSTQGAVQLSVDEMLHMTGGATDVVIQAPPSAWYGVIGGSIIGYAVSGASGILPGMFFGALVWIFIIGG